MRSQSDKSTSPNSPGEPAIDERQIVQAALEILDKAGFDKLTMRNLATSLGIKAASLYWHIRNKHELIGLLAEEICAPMQAPDKVLDWRDQLVFLGAEYRRVLELHHDGARVLLASGPPSGPNRLRLTEMVLGTLLEAGFETKDAAYVAFLLNDYVTMFVLDELQPLNDGESVSLLASMNPGQNWFDRLSPNDYPSMFKLMPYLRQPNMEERFQFGITIILNGLEGLLEDRGKSRNK